MYMSDEEEVLSNVDTSTHWRKKHSMKKRWKTLTDEQKQDIQEEDEDDNLRAMAFADETDDSGSDSEGGDIEDEGEWDFDSTSSPLLPSQDSQTTALETRDDEDGDVAVIGNVYPTTLAHANGQEGIDASDDEYDLNTEIDRGFILRPQTKYGDPRLPSMEEGETWMDYCNKALMEMPQEFTEEEKEQMEAWHSHSNADKEFDWTKWYKNEKREEASAQKLISAGMPSGNDTSQYNSLHGDGGSEEQEQLEDDEDVEMQDA